MKKTFLTTGIIALALIITSCTASDNGLTSTQDVSNPSSVNPPISSSSPSSDEGLTVSEWTKKTSSVDETSSSQQSSEPTSSKESELESKKDASSPDNVEDKNSTASKVSSSSAVSSEKPASNIAIEKDNSTPNKSVVYVTAKGKKYHSSSSCSNMKSPIEKEINEAKAAGYTPCSKCY